jgi:hypothetical protein
MNEYNYLWFDWIVLVFKVNVNSIVSTDAQDNHYSNINNQNGMFLLYLITFSTVQYKNDYCLLWIFEHFIKIWSLYDIFLCLEQIMDHDNTPEIEHQDNSHTDNNERGL